MMTMTDAGPGGALGIAQGAPGTWPQFTAGGGAAAPAAQDVAAGGSTFFSPGTDVPLTTSATPTDPFAASGGAGGVSNFISKNWPALASAGILGVEGLTKNQPLPQEKQLQQQATNAQGLSQALTAPLFTGQLPPGAKQAVEASTAAQKAGIANTYGQLGLSGSTMEAQAKAGVDQRAAAETFQIADQLLAKGIDLSRLSASELQTLLDEQLKQDQAFQQALGTFSGALAGQRLAA
jgi:hypothetical protein